jgi:H+-transporting ATPase
MTGDGVNDAPALKKADCGIAVSGATDAARAAASIVLMSPGLSVIIDAVKESRRIFQRMNSYAIYRISETLRVLVFVTAVILIFNFFPVTAIMIVVLALLNDGSILSIAYDNVHYKDQPERWDMRLVIGMASVLGLIGPIAAFGLFFMADRGFHMDHAHLQTLMYLMLSVAGSLTIFLTRTRGPFWSIRPKRILLLAVLGAEAIATLLAVFGVLMTPLGLKWALVVWGYALAWFLVTDRVKLLAYRLLDPVKDKPPTDKTGAATAPAGALSEAGPAVDLRAEAGPKAGEAGPQATVAAFHAGSGPAGVYHDNSGCAYGQELKANGHSKPGKRGRRRCDWCTQHAA